MRNLLLLGKKTFDYFLSPLIPSKETTSYPEKKKASEIEKDENDACDEARKDDASEAINGNQGGEKNKGKAEQDDRDEEGQTKKVDTQCNNWVNMLNGRHIL
ncbi:hypothetical protein RND81_13G127400 [Saponaria officinalis]|uniref:Uncharacterized protein n=1 Tax=Saponaria officinalis TaxID=3572 RepID=A0AAW1GX93_SAPOF